MSELQDMLRNNPLEVALSENKELHKQLKDINDTSTKVLNELQLECEKNEQLRTQLAKANERVALLERVEKIFNESPELTFENVKSMFSEELNKFAIEKKIEALENTLRENSRPIAYPHGHNTDVIYSEDIEFDIEQLSKEQECEQ